MELWGLTNWLCAGGIPAVGEEYVEVFVAEVLIFFFIVGGVPKEAPSDCERTSVEKFRSAL